MDKISLGATKQYALGFAESQLGVHSRRALNRVIEKQAWPQPRKRSLPIEDEVLRTIHGLAKEDPDLQEEFLAYFHRQMMHLATGKVGAGLHHLHDTADIAQSVVIDMWKELADLRFTSQKEFIALLSQRIRWKVIDKARRYRAERRREDLRKPISQAELLETNHFKPWESLADRETKDRFLLLLTKLPDREAEVLSLYFRGERLQTIAELLHLSKSQVKAFRRSGIQRLRSLGTEGRR